MTALPILPLDKFGAAIAALLRFKAKLVPVEAKIEPEYFIFSREAIDARNPSITQILKNIVPCATVRVAVTVTGRTDSEPALALAFSAANLNLNFES